jgi:DNA-binding phage protein
MPKSAKRKTTKTRTVPYDVAEQLRSPDEMAAYLDAWLAEAPDDVAALPERWVMSHAPKA